MIYIYMLESKYGYNVSEPYVEYVDSVSDGQTNDVSPE